MEKALIVSACERAAASLCRLMSQYAEYDFSIAKCSSLAQELLKEDEYDIALFVLQACDREGESCALSVMSSANIPVIVVLAGDAETAQVKLLNENGIPVMPEPIDDRLFEQLLVLARSTRRRLLDLQKTNELMSRKLAELRIVNRAKFTLMQYLSLTEAQAHRYIEKQAMDMRSTRSEIAENILRTYEIS